MKTIELQLDEETLERAQRLAEARRCTLEQLIKELLAPPAKPNGDPFLGMWAAEPDLVDQVVEAALRAREAHPLRYG